MPNKQNASEGQPQVGTSGCSAVDWSIDVTRGPDVSVPSTVAGGKLKYGHSKMQWSKLRRVVEDAMEAAERGNYLKLTMQFQPFKPMRVASQNETSPSTGVKG